jgi:hypothetical protein
MAKPQRVLTLAFLRPDVHDHWVNRWAARASTHPFCHVELYFESMQQSFSIMWGETASFRSRNLSNPNYELISLLVSPKEYDASLEFCRSASALGLRFDDHGMWGSWFAPVLGCSACEANSQQAGRTFCSKIITEALQFGGLKEVDGFRPAAVTPSRLYECVRKSQRIACNSVPFKRQALMSLAG